MLHNLETPMVGEEDTNMPDWWQEYTGDPLTVTGEGEWIYGSDNLWGDYDEYTNWQDFSYDITPQYNYSSAINPDIMSALEGVFLSDTAGDNSSAYLENYLTDLLGEQEYIHTASGFEEWTHSDEVQDFQNISYEGPQELVDMLPLLSTDIFDPSSIASTLSIMSGLDVDDPLSAIRGGEVRALTPEMLEKTTGQYYSPYEEAEREGLVEKKTKAVGGASTGGFAGSAGRESGLSGAERLNQGGYGDLLAEIEKMKGQSTENVLDTIYGWQELMSSQS